MIVFVAGATGVLGLPSVALLVKAGHAVRGTARTAAKMDLLRALGAEPVLVDLFDPGAVAARVAGSDAVLHLATKIPPLRKMRSRRAWAENDRLRSEASRILVDAALGAGARAYVQESITFLYADGGDRWLDEDAPVGVPPRSNLHSALDAERETERFASSGGSGVVLRLGLFYSATAGSTRDLIAMARRRMLPVVGDGSRYVSSIHTEDAGRAVVAALGAPAGVYNVCDDEPVTQRTYVESLVAAFGLRAPRRSPAALVRTAGGASAPPLLRSQRVSNARFREVTGWAPGFANVREGFPAVARALAEVGDGD